MIDTGAKYYHYTHRRGQQLAPTATIDINSASTFFFKLRYTQFFLFSLKNPCYACFLVQIYLDFKSAYIMGMRSIIPTAHNSDSPLLRRPIFPTMQNRTQSTNPWFNQVYPTGCFVGQANFDEPWPRQNVLERKRSFYPRLYIPVQGNYDRPTWYGIKLKI